jgi:cysteinyl-tRNA synthetase
MFHFEGNYDIHVGGVDLCFPHHEMLRALLMALSGKKKPVKCWMHIGIVDLESTKMSKSTGNAIYLRDLLEKFDSNTLKLYFYSLDYKKIMNFSVSELTRFEEINTMIRNIVSTSIENKDYDTRNDNVSTDSMELRKDTNTNTLEQFYNYIENDLDTPNALELFLQTVVNSNKLNEAREMMKIFGLEY